jgi:CxxC motif-containing protein (DUF1111 family)
MKLKSRKSIGIILSISILIVGCNNFFPAEPAAEEVLAGPLEGLTGPQLNQHIRGDEDFAKVFNSTNGLGPMFITNSCESCHVGDGKGHLLTSLTRFGRYDEIKGTWDALAEKGGPQLQHRAINNYSPENIPTEANGITSLTPPQVTGLGFLEAVDDQTLLALSDSNDLNGDGISGRPNWVSRPEFLPKNPNRIERDGRMIGRFGKKAAAIDLVHQTVNAYIEDMGITSDFRPDEIVNVQQGLIGGDGVPDPEISAGTVNDVVFYLRTLKHPPRRNINDSKVISGETIFLDLKCQKCHTPSLVSGDSPIEALANKTFYPYSDLLLHDMGEELNDNYTEGSAAPREWRTPPLWGIGLSADAQGGNFFLLHDGRATSFEQAILAHGGEGQASKEAFEKLSKTEKEDLYAFLKSL